MCFKNWIINLLTAKSVASESSAEHPILAPLKHKVDFKTEKHNEFQPTPGSAQVVYFLISDSCLTEHVLAIIT